MTPTLASCNRKLIAKRIKDDKRIDGRNREEFRSVDIGFGLDYGSCVVCLGNTKVMSSVVWEIVEARPTKPCEGVLQINVDLSPMASQHFEFARVSDKLVELVRIIEKSIRGSRCVDLESLCLISHEKVWSLKVDVIVLNYEGNLIECCSIAALTSLTHCRRPEVSVSDDKLIIHSFEDKHPVPLRLFHHPFCTTFALFNSGNIVVADPLELEENCCDGHLTVAANTLREVTTLHISGKSRVAKETVLQCCNLTIERSKTLTKLLKTAIAEDEKERDSGTVSFASKIKSKKSVLCMIRKPKEASVNINETEEPTEMEYYSLDPRTKMYRFDNDTVAIGEGSEIAWDVDATGEDETKEPESETASETENSKTKTTLVTIEDESDDEIVILEPTEFKN